jgi:Holliday junction resolvasome RuvABC endonuclease subunit
MVKVLGIDPSLTATGVALLNVTKQNQHEWLIVDVFANKLTGHSRINYIINHELAGIWWLIRHEIYLSQARTGQKHVAIVPPRTRAKYATGNGNASKSEVLKAVGEMFPDQPIIDDNAADAMTFAAMGARWLNMPVDERTPEQIESFMKVEWPNDGL